MQELEPFTAPEVMYKVQIGVKLAITKYYEHNNQAYCHKCILMVKPQTLSKGANLPKTRVQVLRKINCGCNVTKIGRITWVTCHSAVSHNCFCTQQEQRKTRNREEVLVWCAPNEDV